MTWQPIETAPRDGTHIFVCRETNKFSENWTFQQSPPTVAHWFEDGFYTSVNTDMLPETPYEATHWMPLPEPPPV